LRYPGDVEPDASRADGAVHRYLTVRAGDDVCAIPIDCVRRVVSGLEVYAVPGSSGALLGLAEYNGEPLIVVDLASVVGGVGAPAPAGADAVVVRIHRADGDEIVALAVYEALDLVDLTADEMIEESRGVVVGRAPLGATLVQILDLDRWAPELEG
jgi:chemotaxis signal transduction protein